MQIENPIAGLLKVLERIHGAVWNIIVTDKNAHHFTGQNWIVFEFVSIGFPFECISQTDNKTEFPTC